MSSTVLSTATDVLSVFIEPSNELYHLRDLFFHLRGIDYKSPYFQTDANYERNYTALFHTGEHMNYVPPGEFLIDLTKNRTTEYTSGPMGKEWEFNSSCAYELTIVQGKSFFDGSNPNFCAFQATSIITDYCNQHFSPSNEYCTDVNFEANLITPINYNQWHQAHPHSYCPMYCLNPGHYNNDIRQYYFQLALPLASVVSYYREKYSSGTQSWYYMGLRDDWRIAPTYERGSPYNVYPVSYCPAPDDHVACMQAYYTLNSYLWIGPTGGKIDRNTHTYKHNIYI
jgi:hypothetical protein